MKAILILLILCCAQAHLHALSADGIAAKVTGKLYEDIGGLQVSRIGKCSTISAASKIGFEQDQLVITFTENDGFYTLCSDSDTEFDKYKKMVRLDGQKNREISFTVGGKKVHALIIYQNEQVCEALVACFNKPS